VGKPARVINSDLFFVRVADVAVAMLVAIVWAFWTVGAPVLLTVIDVSSQSAPAKTACNPPVCRVLRLTRPATTAGSSLIEKTSRRPASALFSLKRSRVFHGKSRKAYPSSLTLRNGRFKTIGR